MAGKQRAVGISVGRRPLRQQRLPVGIEHSKDAAHRRFVDPPLLGAAIARPLLLLAFRQRPVLEPNDQIAVIDLDCALAAGEHETALPAVGLLDVVLFVVRRRDLEPDAPRRVARTDGEHVGGVVLRRLDVVLVRVGPVQLHLLAVVGNQVGRPAAARITALRDEVALGVVPSEEIGEMVVDVGLGVGVLLHLREAPVQLDDLRRRVPVGIDTERRRRLPGAPQLLHQTGALLVARELQLLLHLRQQVVVEKRHDLGRLQVHDPVQAEVEVAAVELEHFAQQRAQPIELVRGARGRLGAGRGPFRSGGCRGVAHAAVLN